MGRTTVEDTDTCNDLVIDKRQSLRTIHQPRNRTPLKMKAIQHHKQGRIQLFNAFQKTVGRCPLRSTRLPLVELLGGTTLQRTANR